MSLLLKNARLLDDSIVDMQIDSGKIVEIGNAIAPSAHSQTLD